jgi:hypothetical protein
VAAQGGAVDGSKEAGFYVMTQTQRQADRMKIQKLDRTKHNDRILDDWLEPFRKLAKRQGYRTKREVATFVNGYVFGFAAGVTDEAKRKKGGSLDGK